MPRAPASAHRRSVNTLRKENERALSSFLQRLAVPPPEMSICRHDVKLQFCLAKRKDSPLKNAGRWYKLCNRCHCFRWVSQCLDIKNLLRSNEEFGTLIATRESLRRSTSTGNNFVQPTHPEPSTAIYSRSVTLYFWVENWDRPRSVDVPRTAGGAFHISDHKIALGDVEVEKGTKYELFDHITRSWHPILWDTAIFPGQDSTLFFRRQGVTCLPDFSMLALGIQVT